MFCPACGHARERTHAFCPNCGHRFGPAPAVGRDPGSQASDHARLSAARRVHERKFVSVLFADVCGSTEQVARFDPEEAQAFLDRALRLMTRSVEDYGGTISQLLGDGLLALFGAPFALEDHALRACLAAIDMQKRARQAGSDGFPLALRVGVHSGEVLVGSVDHLFASHYRADGATIHLAARLEQRAEPGTVLVTGATARLAGEQVEAVPLGPQSLRGLHGDVEVYELVTSGLRSAAAPLARRRRIGRLVGRAALLASLSSIVDEVWTGQRRAVFLFGEAGIGKTRLVAELCEGLVARGFSQVRVAAYSHTSHTSFAVVADLVRQLLGVRDEEPMLQRESLRAMTASRDGDQPMLRAALVDLLELGEPDAHWKDQTPVQRRRHLADLVYWLVTRQLAAGPLVLVVEDVYLADRDSERLVEGLATRLENMPVLLCFTARQDGGRRRLEARWCSEHVVPPLDTADMSVLASEMLGDHPSLDAVVDRLVERADGNPFFLEQLAITLIDAGTLTGAPGAYVCMAPDAPVSMPASIAGVIAARIDRLPVAAKATLEAASVLGEPVTPGALAAMREIAPDEVDNHLLLAVSLGLLAAPGPNDPPRYRFRHGLVQEVLVGALTRPRRRMLHRAAFLALREQQRADPSAERAALLLDHAYRGEEWAEAAELALTAMTRSVARSANRDAMRVLDLGMNAVRKLGASPSAGPLEVSLSMASLSALLPLGHVDACIANLTRAEAVARQLGDVRRQAAIGLQLAVILWTQGRFQVGLEVADGAMAAATAAGSRSVRMAASQARLMINHGLGRYAALVDEARTMIDTFGPELGRRQVMPGWAVLPSINARTFLADALWRMDEIDEAQRLCDACYEELARAEHNFSRILVDCVQGQIWSAEGRHDDAVSLYQGSLAACVRHDIPTMYPVFCALLGGALARSGSPREGVALIEKGMAEQVDLVGGRYNAYYFPANLAIGLAEAGRHAEAIESATTALKAASSYQQRGHQAQALFDLADIEASAGRPDVALTHYREAAALARDCTMHRLARIADERIAQVGESLRLLGELHSLTMRRGSSA